MYGLRIVAFLLLIVPFTGSNYAINVANIIMLQAMPAIGLALLMGYAGQISLGHSALYGLGAYGTSILSLKYGFHPGFSIVCSISIVAIICDGLGRLIFHLRGHYLASNTIRTSR